MTSNPQKFRVFFGDPDLPQMFMMFLPIFVDRILNSLIGTVHSYFVADAGEAAISAISLANQVNSMLASVFFSVCSAIIIVVAQTVGSGDREKASLTIGHALTFVFYGTSAIGLIFVLFPAWIMKLFFGDIDPEILDQSIKYIRLLGVSLPFEGIFQSCACASRGFNEHKMPMFVSVSGSVIKLIFSFFLIKIFHLGIIGAAIAVLAGRVYNAFIGYYILHRRKWIASLRKCIVVNFRILKNVIYLGVFSSTEHFTTMFAGTIKTGYLVPYGVSHITASSVFGTFNELFNTIPFCMTTLVRNYVAIGIGSKNIARAHHMIWKCYIYNVTLSIIMWVSAFFALPHIFPLYTQNEETLGLLAVILLLNTFGQPILSIFAGTIRAALDGAGDAKFATVVTMICLLVFDLGLGYILTVNMGLGIIGATISGLCSMFVKSIVYFIRYKSGRWKNHVMV